MTRDKIEELYNEYMHNIDVSPFEIIYLHPLELDYKIVIPWEECIKSDQYVNKYNNDRMGLALDVLEKGNYFPFWAREQKGGYFLKEGAHRIVSINKAIEHGIWEDKKIACTVVHNMESLSNDCNIKAYIPIYDSYNYKPFVERYRHHISYFLGKSKEDIKNFKGEGSILVTVTNMDAMMHVFMFYHNLLRDVIFEYNDSHDDFIEARFPLQ